MSTAHILAAELLPQSILPYSLDGKAMVQVQFYRELNAVETLLWPVIKVPNHEVTTTFSTGPEKITVTCDVL